MYSDAATGWHLAVLPSPNGSHFCQYEWASATPSSRNTLFFLFCSVPSCQWWRGCYLMFPFVSVPHQNHCLLCSQLFCFIYLHLHCPSISSVVYLGFFSNWYSSVMLLLAAVRFLFLIHARTNLVFALLFCQPVSFLDTEYHAQSHFSSYHVFLLSTIFLTMSLLLWGFVFHLLSSSTNIVNRASVLELRRNTHVKQYICESSIMSDKIAKSRNKFGDRHTQKVGEAGYILNLFSFKLLTEIRRQFNSQRRLWIVVL